jgi:predicted DNA-binding transcriptional regulator AlpA
MTRHERPLPATRLLGAREVALRCNVSVSTVHQGRWRRRMESLGFPAPRLARPLGWSAEAVERWINGAPAGPEAPADSVEDWRARLSAEYGSPG